MKEFIKKKIQGEKKILIENFFFLSLLKVFGYIFPLITLPYLTNVIGVERFGELAFAASIMVFFETFIDFGFNYTATRDFAKCRYDLKESSKVYSQVMAAKFVFVIFSFLILTLLIVFVPIFQEIKILLYFTFSYVIGYVLFPEWVFQALEKMKFITLLNLLSKLIFTVLVFVIIQNKEDYIYQPLLISGGYFVAAIISLWILHKRYNIIFQTPNISLIYVRMKSSFNMFVSLLIPNLYTNFSVVFLKLTCGSADTGIFSAGQKIVLLIDQLFQVLSRTFFPFLARRIDKHGVYNKIGVMMSLIMCAVLFILSPYIIHLIYNEEYYDSIEVLQIMSISPFLLFVMNSYGQNYLVLIGKEKALRNIIIISAVIGFTLTLILVKEFSFKGVALTIMITWAIRAFLTFITAEKIRRNEK